MKPIAGNAVVSCYVDAASLAAMILLQILSERPGRREDAQARIFRMLSLCITVNCILPFAYHAMYMQTAPWCHAAALAARTLRECMVPVILVFWLVFADYRMHGGKNLHTHQFRIALLPLAGMPLLLTVNLFTGIVFTYSADNLIEPRPLLYIMFVVELVYFVCSAVMVHYSDRKSEKARFLHTSLMILSFVTASGTQLITPYDIGILGYVFSIILLRFSMIIEGRFTDEESGLYSRGQLTYLFDLAKSGKKDYRSALIMEPGGNLPAAYDILRDTLNKKYDVIRTEEKKIMLFSGKDNRSALQLLSTHVEEAVEKHNTEHPTEKVRITVHSRIRAEGEDAFAFIRSTLEEKETGDPVRGVVSMISELDRLDNELKLAADIQANALPASFPPFPDRTEFDLYASMTPAREVGGDFYDFFLTDSDHLALVIADVSGKGVPAALFMMASRTLIRNQLMSGSDPAAALERVNLQLCERNSTMMFVTVWLAVLQISTGRGKACNAGHENPEIRRAGGGFEALKYKHGMLVGVSRKAKYENREFEMQPGDCVFVYTDGVPEAENADQDMFGEERLTGTLNQDADAGPEELIRRVHDEVDRFADGAPQFDDITMLCLKYYGNRGSVL